MIRLIERWGSLAAAGLLCVGCHEAPPPAAGSTPAAQVAAPAAPEAAPEAAPRTVPGTAAPLGSEPPDRAAVRKARLDGMRRGLRVAHFDAQGAVPLPAAIDPGLAPLVPTQGKLVDFEVHRRMHALAPTDGRRVVLRWLTRLDGPAAETLARETVGAWVGAPPAEGASEAKHARWGAVTWRVHVPEERATRVEVIVEGPDDGALTLPALAPPPAWAEALSGAVVEGYEHGRYHARGGNGYTDLERLSAMVATEDGAGLQAKLEAAMIAAGYRADDDDPRLLRGPGAERTTFTTRLSAGRLTLHHQRRWRWSESEPAPGAGSGER